MLMINDPLYIQICLQVINCPELCVNIYCRYALSVFYVASDIRCNLFKSIREYIEDTSSLIYANSSGNISTPALYLYKLSSILHYRKSKIWLVF